MINPDLLVDSVRDKLKAIPAVVTNLVEGDAGRITSYTDVDTSLIAAVYEMQTPSILVGLVGNEASEEGLGAWLWVISIFLRLQGVRIGSAFYDICNSVATGDQQKFTETEFMPEYEQIGVPILVRDPDEEGIEHPRIDMRFRQRSQD